MSNSTELITLDVRGEICPAPLIKALDAMRTAGKSQQIEMVTDFLPAVLTVTNAALKEGWDITIRRIGPSEWRVFLSQIDDSILSG